MAWLAQELDDDPPEVRYPRRIKNRAEDEGLRQVPGSLQGLDFVFFDTTSLFFTGEGGESPGPYDKSKDRRNGSRQMVPGIVLDAAGISMPTEMSPGNTADTTALDLVTGRPGKHFGVGMVRAMADAGMISKRQIAATEARGGRCILDAGPRANEEVRQVVPGDEPPLGEIGVELQRPRPMKLEGSEVVVGMGKEGPGRRYIVCRNPEQAVRDTAKRAEVAPHYKQLRMVERLCRHAKNLLETRPIFHRTDATICAHVFCSLLALATKQYPSTSMGHRRS